MCDTYSCAHERLRDEPINALGYIILAGTNASANEGLVISRNQWGAVHEDFINDTTFFLVQTNDDHWTGTCLDRC